MKFEKVTPSDKLKPYIKHFVISESELESTYKVFPSTSMVIGFQYQGQLAVIRDNLESNLDTAGITGLSDSFKIFRNSPHIGTILVYFTEVGLSCFTSCPANELFNQSVSLDYLFRKPLVQETEEKLSLAQTNQQRINIVGRFLLSHLKNIRADNLVTEAVKLIYNSQGSIKIAELSQKLFISQSPLEKRFRRIVGTSPKKFASIVRFNRVLNEMGEAKSLTQICYENNFFNQAHFIKDFKQYTGETPESYKRFL